jgi:hypothetical protein
MTSHEALVLGLVWGVLSRTLEATHGWTVHVPGYGPTVESAPGVVVLRAPSGVELLVTVTTRPAAPADGEP